jgi:hypothetical protein
MKNKDNEAEIFWAIVTLLLFAVTVLLIIFKSEGSIAISIITTGWLLAGVLDK